jgi:hypothetical protein
MHGAPSIRAVVGAKGVYKGKNYILSRILSFKFDYIYKWHVCLNFTFVLGLNYVVHMRNKTAK